MATMLVAPNLPPNHGTVLVDLPEGRYLVEAMGLSEEIASQIPPDVPTPPPPGSRTASG